MYSEGDTVDQIFKSKTPYEQEVGKLNAALHNMGVYTAFVPDFSLKSLL